MNLYEFTKVSMLSMSNVDFINKTWVNLPSTLEGLNEDHTSSN